MKVKKERKVVDPFSVHVRSATPLDPASLRTAAAELGPVEMIGMGAGNPCVARLEFRSKRDSAQALALAPRLALALHPFHRLPSHIVEVTGLPYSFDRAAVESLFFRSGPVLSLKHHPHTRSATLAYPEARHAQAALALDGLSLDGATIHVRPAGAGRSRTVTVVGVAGETTEGEVMLLFRRVCAVESVRFGGEGKRRCAYVQVSSEADIPRALALNGTTLHNHSLTVRVKQAPKTE